MADLRVRDFPDDLLDEAKSEASLDGETLKSFVAEAVQREVERRRAMPVDERRELRAERRRLRAEGRAAKAPGPA